MDLRWSRVKISYFSGVTFKLILGNCWLVNHVWFNFPPKLKKNNECLC